MAQYLVFESRGYHFAILASEVVKLGEFREEGASFSQCVFGEPELEPYLIAMKSGIQLRVHALQESVGSAAKSLPVPGYIFESDNSWLRGILWETDPKTLLLNEEMLSCILHSA